MKFYLVAGEASGDMHGVNLDKEYSCGNLTNENKLNIQFPENIHTPISMLHFFYLCEIFGNTELNINCDLLF